LLTVTHLLILYCRWNSWFWESCIQCIWVYPCTTRHPEVQGFREEVHQWHSLLCGCLHANHGGSGRHMFGCSTC